MYSHLQQLKSDAVVDAALVASPIPAGEKIRVQTEDSRIILLEEGDFELNLIRPEPAMKVEMHPGDALIIPDDSYYSYQPLTSDKDVVLKAFRIRYVGSPHRLVGLPAGNTLFPFPAPPIEEFIFIPKARNPRIAHLIDLYRTEYELEYFGKEELLKCISAEIYIDIMRQAHLSRRKGAQSTPRNRVIVNTVIRYLHQNLNKAFSLDELGWRLGLSGEHVARVFKKELGQTVFQYLKELRMDKAAQLLMQTNHLVHEIAEMTGFSSHSLFSREFRKIVGISPEEYRSRSQDTLSWEKI